MPEIRDCRPGPVGPESCSVGLPEAYSFPEAFSHQE